MSVTTEYPSLLTDEDLRRELADARILVDVLLHQVRDFTTISHAEPWRYLDDVLGDLRAASTTVAVLEQLQGRRAG